MNTICGKGKIHYYLNENVKQNVCKKYITGNDYEQHIPYEMNTIIQDILTDIVNIVIGFSGNISVKCCNKYLFSLFGTFYRTSRSNA